MTTLSVNTVEIYRASNGIMQIEDTVNPQWRKKKENTVKGGSCASGLLMYIHMF